MSSAEIVAGDAPEPQEVARVIVATLFNGKLRADATEVAKGTITAALGVWRSQILAAAKLKYRGEREKYLREKTRADEIAMRLTLLEKKTGVRG